MASGEGEKGWGWAGRSRKRPGTRRFCAFGTRWSSSRPRRFPSSRGRRTLLRRSGPCARANCCRGSASPSLARAGCGSTPSTRACSRSSATRRRSLTPPGTGQRRLHHHRSRRRHHPHHQRQLPPHHPPRRPDRTHPGNQRVHHRHQGNRRSRPREPRHRNHVDPRARCRRVPGRSEAHDGIVRINHGAAPATATPTITAKYTPRSNSHHILNPAGRCPPRSGRPRS